tara:strand:+ start:399 stop:938 length:540 start_codon:yes stop_codon:yes gene_type:complete
MIIGNNETVEMTRRHFDLPQKVLQRDAKVAKQLINAWDNENNPDKVLAIFKKNQNKLSSQRYWELLRTVWIICGNIENISLFKVFFSSPKKNRYCFSTPEEHEALRMLPEIITVYRACNSTEDNGISWTTSREYAKYYAEAYNKKMILESKVDKKHVFALINRNKESEILILNSNVLQF